MNRTANGRQGPGARTRDEQFRNLDAMNLGPTERAIMRRRLKMPSAWTHGHTWELATHTAQALGIEPEAVRFADRRLRERQLVYFADRRHAPKGLRRRPVFLGLELRPAHLGPLPDDWRDWVVWGTDGARDGHRAGDGQSPVGSDAVTVRVEGGHRAGAHGTSVQNYEGEDEGNYEVSSTKEPEAVSDNTQPSAASHFAAKQDPAPVTTPDLGDGSGVDDGWRDYIVLRVEQMLRDGDERRAAQLLGGRLGIRVADDDVAAVFDAYRADGDEAARAAAPAVR